MVFIRKIKAGEQAVFSVVLFCWVESIEMREIVAVAFLSLLGCASTT